MCLVSDPIQELQHTCDECFNRFNRTLIAPNTRACAIKALFTCVLQCVLQCMLQCVLQCMLKCRKHTSHVMSVLQCVAVQKAHTSCDECVNRTSFCIWVKGTQSLALITIFAKVIIILPPLYVPILNQLSPGAGRMFKALWDRCDFHVPARVILLPSLSLG